MKTDYEKVKRTKLQSAFIYQKYSTRIKQLHKKKKYILKKGILDPCSSFKMMNMSYPTSRDPSTAGREAFLTAYILENKIYN